MRPVEQAGFKEREIEVRQQIVDARSRAARISRDSGREKETATNLFGHTVSLSTDDTPPTTQKRVNTFMSLIGFATGGCFALAFFTYPKMSWTLTAIAGGIGFAFLAYRILRNKREPHTQSSVYDPIHRDSQNVASLTSIQSPIDSEKKSAYLEMETVS